MASSPPTGDDDHDDGCDDDGVGGEDDDESGEDDNDDAHDHSDSDEEDGDDEDDDDDGCGDYDGNDHKYDKCHEGRGDYDVHRTREDLKGRSYEQQGLLLVELTDQGWQALRNRGYQVDKQAYIPSSPWSAGGRRGGRRPGPADLPPQLARAGAQVDRRDLHGLYSFKY